MASQFEASEPKCKVRGVKSRRNHKSGSEVNNSKVARVRVVKHLEDNQDKKIGFNQQKQRKWP